MKTGIFRIAKTAPIPLLLPFLIGCTDSHSPTASFLSRDSAGIRIWEYADLPPADSAVWTVAEEPVLVIGEEDGDDPFLFARIRGTVALPQNGVAVADGLSNEIRYFDGAGYHLHSSGGEGSGPGEFTRIRRAFSYSGDSIAATNGTVSVFSSGGEWGRSVTCQPASESFTALFVEGALEGGAFLVRAMKQFRTEAPSEGFHREPSVFQICSREGAAGPILAEFPDRELETLNQEGRFMTFPLEMGRKAISVIVGNEVFVGVTDRLELWRYGVDGELNGILRVKGSPTLMTDEIRTRWIDHTMDSADDPETAQQTSQRYRDRIWPDSLPAFSDLKADSEGNLWVRQFAPEYLEGPSDWWVFSPDGSFRARATLPESLRLDEIGSDFVLGVMADELGVERVYRYELEKGDRPGAGQ
jgi:hypothetical protein